MQVVGLNKLDWKDRRVFVTGHTGLLGGWLCSWLTSMGDEVAGYALPPTTKSGFFDATSLDRSMCSVFSDIRDLERLTATLHDFAPQVVIHAAAQALVRAAHATPVETFATNVMGTVNLLQAIRSVPSVEAAVVITTDKVYENLEWDWGYREDDRLGGREPYGASKACAELATEAFRETYFSDPDRKLGIATVRAGNIIGGGDWAADRIIPDAIRAFSASEPLIIRNPNAVRPWQHVLDPARGILMITERLLDDPESWSAAWNLGPAEHDAQPVSQVAETVTRLWGNGARWAPHSDAIDAPYEARLLTLNSAKAANRLGWRPLWPLERALTATIEWYQAQFAGRDVRQVTEQQIAAFEGVN